MKTRELIAALHEQDPTGELEVIADGRPIYFLECQAAYQDGRLHVPIHTDAETWNIIGWRITGEGEKVRMHLVSLDDALEVNPEMPVEIIGLDAGLAGWLERARERARRFAEKAGGAG